MRCVTDWPIFAEATDSLALSLRAKINKLKIKHDCQREVAEFPFVWARCGPGTTDVTTILFHGLRGSQEPLILQVLLHYFSIPKLLHGSFARTSN